MELFSNNYVFFRTEISNQLYIVFSIFFNYIAKFRLYYNWLESID